jgi:N-terminal domain of toast_rack, DUF2154
MCKRWLNVTLSAALMWAGTSCIHLQPPRTDARTLSRSDATAVLVDLRMTSGQLHVHGGASKLIDATFHYAEPSQAPRLNYVERGSSGYAQVFQQMDEPPALGVADETWDVAVSDSALLGFNCMLGTGRAYLDLRGLWLFRLALRGHADDLTVDLRNIHTKKLTVLLLNGPGPTTLYLPDHLPVEIRSKNPMIEVRGNLTRLGDDWVNAAFGSGSPVVSVLIDADAGPVTVIGE